MIVYRKTFENVKKSNINFPVEDQYYTSDNEAIVADGITRDPEGVDDISSCPLTTYIERYPKPSGAELVAKAICASFPKTKGSLKERLVECNKEVKRINDKYIKSCDYLTNDYYGAVASCVHIQNNVLDYAYVCDCGVIVYDKNGNVKFQTIDDKEAISDPYISKNGFEWSIPKDRATVRKTYRNNINNIQDGKCVSFGALTGEDSFKYFIKTGQIKLEEGDRIVVHSDGFIDYLNEKDFIDIILDFDKEKFENYIKDKSSSNGNIYGREKTIILFKN